MNRMLVHFLERRKLVGKKPRFSLQDFKEFLSKDEDMKKFFEISPSSDDDISGVEAMPKVSKKKILENIEVETGDVDEVVEEFMKNGGSIVESEGKKYLITTESGDFRIPMFCVGIND